jgi:hypothetical protein
MRALVRSHRTFLSSYLWSDVSFASCSASRSPDQASNAPLLVQLQTDEQSEYNILTSTGPCISMISCLALRA